MDNGVVYTLCWRGNFSENMRGPEMVKRTDPVWFGYFTASCGTNTGKDGGKSGRSGSVE